MSAHVKGLDACTRVSRRAWLTQQLGGVIVLAPHGALGTWVASRPGHGSRRDLGRLTDERAARVATQSTSFDPAPWEALAERAVDAARSAGATYADARLTRVVQHLYGCAGPSLELDAEYVGVGVRTLVGGAWGFSASTVTTPDEVVRLAKDAVGQARENGTGGRRGPVELGTVPVARGHWVTPIRIDPFQVSIEEKLDFITTWKSDARQGRTPFVGFGLPSSLLFVRREEVTATSEGSLFAQTFYSSGGDLRVSVPSVGGALQDQIKALANPYRVPELVVTAAGWELFVDAKLSKQFLSGQIRETIERQMLRKATPFTIGKYTLVCDGLTMAALVEATLGAATQIDRALGYEANAGGTGWLTDPLGQVGTVQLTSPLVTLTADRTMPQGLATVRWEAEGVAAPVPFPLLKNGVLVDFQTTREQAAWLAPYYTKSGQPVRSHGCAGAENAHRLPLQQMPNLTLAPGTGGASLSDLVTDVTDGILIEGGQVVQMDSQARTGLLLGDMREIKNGKPGRTVTGGVVLFDSQALWTDVKALGGPATAASLGYTPEYQFQNDFNSIGAPGTLGRYTRNLKGEPGQSTGHTVQAVAAIIPNQPMIDPMRKV